MSTRGVIAFGPNILEWEGRYHHFDSYPTALGKTLYDAYHNVFARTIETMKQYLFTEHPAGWSSINHADFSKNPGYDEGRNRPNFMCMSIEEFKRLNNLYENEHNQPHCYCHGDSHEEETLITPDDSKDCFLEWLYVITSQHTMEICSKKFNDDGSYEWEFITSVALSGEEPDWNKIERIDNDDV
jgi:hypothetical protein